MNDYWYGICPKCDNDIYSDENGYNVWCYACDEEPDLGDSILVETKIEEVAE